MKYLILVATLIFASLAHGQYHTEAFTADLSQRPAVHLFTSSTPIVAMPQQDHVDIPAAAIQLNRAAMGMGLGSLMGGILVGTGLYVGGPEGDLIGYIGGGVILAAILYGAYRLGEAADRLGHRAEIR